MKSLAQFLLRKLDDIFFWWICAFILSSRLDFSNDECVVFPRKVPSLNRDSLWRPFSSDFWPEHDVEHGHVTANDEEQGPFVARKWESSGQEKWQIQTTPRGVLAPKSMDSCLRVLDFHPCTWSLDRRKWRRSRFIHSITSRVIGRDWPMDLSTNANRWDIFKWTIKRSDEWITGESITLCVLFGTLSNDLELPPGDLSTVLGFQLQFHPKDCRQNLILHHMNNWSFVFLDPWMEG